MNAPPGLSKHWSQLSKHWPQLEKKQNRELFIIVLNSDMINHDILFNNNIFYNYKTSNSLNIYPKKLIFTRFKKNKSHEIKNTMFNFIQSCNDNGRIATYEEIKNKFKSNKFFKVIMALYGKDNGDDIFYFCNHHKNELYAEWDIDYNNIIVKILIL